MTSHPKTLSLQKNPADAHARAVESIQHGGLILFPTETVYGLGCDSQNSSMIEKLYDLKGRPREKPFQWLVSDVEQIRPHVETWSPHVEKLARAFWPGPMTLVLTGSNGSIGWRIPNHPWLLDVLKELNSPMVATSANLSGEPPSKTFEEAWNPFKDQIDLAVDGGTITGGIPSTVVSLEKDSVRILREGALSNETILQALSFQG